MPIGGLSIRGYLEIIIDPAHNLPEIGKITKTPVSVFSVSGEPVNISKQDTSGFLPVKYTLLTSDGEPAYRIVGYENVSHTNCHYQRVFNINYSCTVICLKAISAFFIQPA